MNTSTTNVQAGDFININVGNPHDIAYWPNTTAMVVETFMDSTGKNNIIGAVVNINNKLQLLTEIDITDRNNHNDDKTIYFTCERERYIKPEAMWEIERFLDGRELPLAIRGPVIE